jgi:hypothetical protein
MVRASRYALWLFLATALAASADGPQAVWHFGKLKMEELDGNVNVTTELFLMIRPPVGDSCPYLVPALAWLPRVCLSPLTSSAPAGLCCVSPRLPCLAKCMSKLRAMALNVALTSLYPDNWRRRPRWIRTPLFSISKSACEISCGSRLWVGALHPCRRA